MRLLALLLALAACGKGDSDASDPGPGSARPGGSSDKVVGGIAVEGRQARLLGCRVGHNVHTFVDVVTSSGAVRFEDGALFFNPDRDASAAGKKLDCTRFDRSWGGGTRTDGTSYFRGKLDFDCGSVTGEVDIECGGLTTAERLQLESNRQDMLSQKRGDRTIELAPFATTIPDGWIDIAASGDPALGRRLQPGARGIVAERPADPKARAVISFALARAPASWKSCLELPGALPPIDKTLPEPTLTTMGSDKACVWKLSADKDSGRMVVRVHDRDALMVTLMRAKLVDADADRAFEQVLATLEVK